MPMKPPTHRPHGYQTPKQTLRDLDRFRGSAASRGYDAAWTRTRLAFLQAHPLCQDCERAGVVRVADEVHHLVKIKDRPDLRLDETNLRALCRPCHGKRTRTGE